MARVKSYKTIFDDSPPRGYTKVQIQIAELEGGRVKRGLHIKKGMSEKERGFGFTLYTPSYKGLRALIDGMVEIYGKEEVEKQLRVKI